MSEWMDLNAALQGNAPINTSEAYRTFVRAANEIYDLTMSTKMVEHFIDVDWENNLPFSRVYGSTASRTYFNAIDPNQPGFVPLLAADGQVAKYPFMPIAKGYLAQVYTAYNQLKKFRIARSLGRWSSSDYHKVMYFPYSTSVVDGFHTLVNNLELMSAGWIGWSCDFHISPHRSYQGVDTWRGELDISLPNVIYNNPSAVLQSGALLLGGTISGNYGPLPNGSWYEVIADATLGSSGWAGNVPLPVISDSVLSTLDPNNLHELIWRVKDVVGPVIDRKYTNYNQYLKV